MKITFIALTITGLLSTASLAFADDPPNQNSQSMSADSTSDGMNNSDAMKQCMAKQKANNSGLTHAQMQTTCKNEIKGGKLQKNGNDLATGPQAGDKPPQQ